MDKRNKAWRRKQFARVFKARMVYHAAFFGVREFVLVNSEKVYHPHWFELAKSEWYRAYKTTGTPCSCAMCRGESYNRREFKKETKRIIKETSDC